MKICSIIVKAKDFITENYHWLVSVIAGVCCFVAFTIYRPDIWYVWVLLSAFAGILFVPTFSIVLYGVSVVLIILASPFMLLFSLVTSKKYDYKLLFEDIMNSFKVVLPIVLIIVLCFMVATTCNKETKLRHYSNEQYDYEYDDVFRFGRTGH